MPSATRRAHARHTRIPCPKRTVAVACGIALLVALSGCGGDDDTSDREQSSDTTDSTRSGSDATNRSSTEATSEPSPAEGEPVLSPGCDDPTATKVEREQHDLTVGGAERFYLLTAPEGTDPVPLVLDFHGLLEGAPVHAEHSKMGEYGLDEGFITAFPHGSGNPIRWDAGNIESGDLAVVDTILDDIGSSRCIDESRVYAMGLSNGAMMTSLLACTRSDRFAAFAPVAGLMVPNGCEPSRGVPIRAFHGTADPILRFNGGITLNLGGGQQTTEPLPEADLDGEGYPETARQWAELNGCDEESTDEDLTDEIVERTWDCPEGAELEFLIVKGGGHTWPGSEFSTRIERVVGPTTFDISANEAAWEFFQQYQLPA